VLNETALGIGIALGPLLGGLLGEVSWRGPFYGVSVLMFIALVATLVLLPATPRPARRQGLLEPIKALRHRSLAATGVVGLLYNWTFFTLLGYSPFLMNISSPFKLGLVFCAWGVLVAIFAIFGAPLLKDRFGTARALYGNFVLLALTLLVIGLFPGNLTVVIVAVIISGIFSGVNNTLVTTAVMSIAPVERPVASATYGFVRFIGGGLAPFAAGKLVERFNEHVPFILATITAIVAAVVLSSVHQALERADRGEVAQPEPTTLDRVERQQEAGVSAGLGNEI